MKLTELCMCVTQVALQSPSIVPLEIREDTMYGMYGFYGAGTQEMPSVGGTGVAVRVVSSPLGGLPLSTIAAQDQVRTRFLLSFLPSWIGKYRIHELN
jgi:hypothetical protein